MARRPDETDGNAVDRAVQRVAAGLSRRSFLSKLGKLGLGAGLGLAGVGSALAAFCEDKYQWTYAGCCGAGRQSQKEQKRQCCTYADGHSSCSSWQNTGKTRCVNGPC